MALTPEQTMIAEDYFAKQAQNATQPQPVADPVVAQPVAAEAPPVAQPVPAYGDGGTVQTLTSAQQNPAVALPATPVDLTSAPAQTVPSVPNVPVDAGQLASDANAVQQQAPQAPNPLALQSLGVGSNVSDSFSREKSALGEQANAAANQANAEANVYKNTIAEANKLDAKGQQALAAYEAEVNNQKIKTENAINEFSSMKVDPDRKNIFKIGSTGDKIGAGIAIVLSGLGAGMQGKSTNSAMDVFNKAIDNDIAAQQAEIDTKGKGASQQQNLYNQMLQQFGNKQAAVAATKAAMLQNTQLKLSEAASRFKAPQVQAQAAAQMEQLERAKQVNILQTAQLVAAANKPAFSGSQIPLNTLPGGIQDPKLAARWVPGSGLAGSTEVAKEAMDSNSMTQQAIRGIDILANEKLSSASLADRARANTIVNSLIGSLRVPLTGPGAMSEGDRKLLEGIIANPTDIFSYSGSNKAKLNALAERLKMNNADFLEARGLKALYPQFSATERLKTLKPNEK